MAAAVYQQPDVPLAASQQGMDLDAAVMARSGEPLPNESELSADPEPSFQPTPPRPRATSESPTQAGPEPSSAEGGPYPEPEAEPVLVPTPEPTLIPKRVPPMTAMMAMMTGAPRSIGTAISPSKGSSPSSPS